ncbi:MAG: hypothetical protein A2Y17_07525 [Clostridiales bacterium GWF2_38_85]|nr:MAG: hypothetical protein A2Y17_07525 [Clostridiales bacterium GWF2_38_85]
MKILIYNIKKSMNLQKNEGEIITPLKKEKCMSEIEKSEDAILRIPKLSEIMPPYELEIMPKNIALAMAYVPFQMWSDDMYELEKALEKGTLFPELDKPFLAGRVRK